MTMPITKEAVRVRAETTIELEGNLNLPANAEGIVLFAHGSGSSRHSPRNQFVASSLNNAHLGTLLIDLLTPDEEEKDMVNRAFRFDIELLARRLTGTIDWLIKQDASRQLKIGLFGASTGAGAALVAASLRTSLVSAVVSRGGRPDLAAEALTNVQAPTLLIVGENDPHIIELNRKAMQTMRGTKELEIVPRASHLFEEEGTLEIVAKLDQNWFLKYLVEQNPDERS